MIEISGLSITIGSFSLRDVNLAVADSEYFVLLGPTGAGKTVLLECIAGLHRVVSGTIHLHGMDVTQLAPEERHIGYVPQDYVLFPFLNVFENVAFGLKGSGRRPDTLERVKAVAELAGISHLLERDTRSLSGGEKQRVALARALAPPSRVLLLDEPLSNLDLQTSKYLRLELRRIQQELGITTIHVTHNQVEAEEMADRIAVFNAGKLEQVGKPQEVFFSPGNEAVSNFIGALNILDCDSSRVLGPGLTEVDCKGMRVILPHDGNFVRKIAFLPSDVYVSNVPPPGPSVNRFTGVITGVEPLGALVRLQVKTGENVLKAEVSRDLFEDMDLSVGKEVYLKLKLRRMRVLEE